MAPRFGCRVQMGMKQDQSGEKSQSSVYMQRALDPQDP